MRVTNKLLALRARLNRENVAIVAFAMPLLNRNELASEIGDPLPHLSYYLGVPIIVSERIKEPCAVVTA